jgi:hypothetical protein
MRLAVIILVLHNPYYLCDALKQFDAKLVESEDGRYRVEIPLAGAKKTVAALHALEEYVTQRGDGAARVDYGGHPYVLEPAPAD